MRVFYSRDYRQKLKKIGPPRYEQSCENNSAQEFPLPIQEKISRPIEAGRSNRWDAAIRCNREDVCPSVFLYTSGKPNERDTRGNKDYASLTVEKRCQAFSGVNVGRVAMPTQRLVLAVEHETCQILALHSSPAWRRASR
jgi:hypothetical protein